MVKYSEYCILHEESELIATVETSRQQVSGIMSWQQVSRENEVTTTAWDNEVTASGSFLQWNKAIIISILHYV